MLAIGLTWDKQVGHPPHALRICFCTIVAMDEGICCWRRVAPAKGGQMPPVVASGEKMSYVPPAVTAQAQAYAARLGLSYIGVVFERKIYAGEPLSDIELLINSRYELESP